MAELGKIEEIERKLNNFLQQLKVAIDQESRRKLLGEMRRLLDKLNNLVY
jgi:hypothetical protein